MTLNTELLARCKAAGIPLSGHAAEVMGRFHAMLMDWNSRMDLTAVLDESEMLDRHYIDSLTPLSISGLIPEGARLIDVGSGAGFPGIPLAIARPDLSLTLMDAQQKRVRFLQAAVQELGLVHVKVLHGRAEDVGHLPLHREQYDLAVARAVAPLPVLLEYLLPFVKTGGKALCWKGPAVLDEISVGGKAASVLGGVIEEPVSVRIPGRDWNHLLLPIVKTGKTPRQYPRKAGMPGKAALGSV